ncbi:hypothetical protein MSG28_015162 [Choristoneura fumiferana]|uniref:Uncharacterized protein n=1 Tax=Choristoneura fumiferana TaxID=7141 RepID=A0ACC0KZQ3_CHOFU|nr:hypothetical protein MSG28_015162 [Choristoneura fumiferana]
MRKVAVIQNWHVKIRIMASDFGVMHQRSPCDYISVIAERNNKDGAETVCYYFDYQFAGSLKRKMRSIIIICFFTIVMCALRSSEASYRKPPFNGSIFGKRGNMLVDNSVPILILPRSIIQNKMEPVSITEPAAKKKKTENSIAMTIEQYIEDEP